MAEKKAARSNGSPGDTQSPETAWGEPAHQDQLVAADVAELADCLCRGVSRKEWLDAHIDRIPLWEQAAGRGTAHGLMLTGLCHWFGVGRDVDHEAARPFFKKAAKKGDPQAQFSLGQLILIKAQEGQGTETAEDAYNLFLASAASGLAQAQFSVAEALWKGDGVEEDEKAAIVWWKAAAEQGHAEAALLLARLHLKGWPSAGIEKDRDAALDWGRRAATAGLDEAATWVSEHENGPDPDESYVISNIPGYVSEMRLGELSLNNVVSISPHAAESLARHNGPVSLEGLQTPADESNIRSTLALRDAIAKAPSILQPVGTYGVVFNEDDLTARDDFLENSDESSLYSDVQMAVGEYLASISVPDVRSFVSRPALPPEFDKRRVSFTLANCNAEVALDTISGDILRQLYEAAAPAAFGDMKAMETRIDPLVRSGREIASHGFSVSPELCRWVERTWAEHFVPKNVRAEPYKVNLYGPGDRFATHRDTPEKNLVGTFLVALGGWGPPCQGGGLVVHDTAGTYRWDGVRGWAAFIPYLAHEVEPITFGARATIAFKVFATSNDRGDESVAFDEALLEEAANRIALCRNENGQVGVLLSFAYSLNGTALCGRDLFIYRALEQLGRVESIPVAVHMEAKAPSSDAGYWSTHARVYSLTQENLARVTKGFKQPADNRLPVPFIATAAGHEVYKESHASVEWAGNYAEPANVDTLYVQRALIVTPTGEGSRGPVRCAGADFRRCDLSRRDFQDADLAATDLTSANLSRSKVHRAKLDSANLHRANLSRASLQQTDLTNANLTEAKLVKADLTEATLCGANLAGASLSDALLTGVRSDEGTKWPDGFDLAEHTTAMSAKASRTDQWPDPAGTVTNSLGMKFVPVPAGEFLMGTPGDAGEEYQHPVRITKPFLLGMHQVTQSQYERVTGENPSLFEGRDRPVEHVSWKQAARFCELLSSLPDELQAGRRYRLPTEAEWEYACRAGTTTLFNTGDTLGQHQARFASKSLTEPKKTRRVGSYPPNPWGLFDMHGNVWEWTNDWFSSEYYRESPAEDPQGPRSGTHHTLRGGSASVQAHECASAFGGEAAAVDGPKTTTGQRFALYGDLGIRVVCEVKPKETT